VLRILLLLFSTTVFATTKLHTSDKDFNYTFSVTNKQPKHFQTSKTYFWFKAHQIQSTVGGANGKVLDGFFQKEYRSQQLATQGYFVKGLKDKTWRSWYQNGQLKEVTRWRNGQKSGDYQLYNEQGDLEVKGKYNKGLKVGEWIYAQKKDTLTYRKGVLKSVKVKKTRIKKERSLKDFFKKSTQNIKDWWGRMKIKFTGRKRKKVSTKLKKSKKRTSKTAKRS